MKDIVIIGVGQLGRVFAGGMMRCGFRVVPVNRGDSMEDISGDCPKPELVLVAVAEPDLHPVLTGLPHAWRDKLGMIQNELLPRDWKSHGIQDPTVVSVWFEKKKGMDARPLIASPVAGPKAGLLVSALQSVDLPVREVKPGPDLLFELVRKNVYILTTNIAGIKTGGTVRNLWLEHEGFARKVAEEVMDIQDWLTGIPHNREKLIAGMLEAFDGDPNHVCTGRSATARLARAIAHADQAGLAVPTLRGLQS